MKRLIFSGMLMLAFAVFASAQTNTGNSSRNTGSSSAGAKRTVNAKSKKGTKDKTLILNQRKEYKSGSGQTATPTGQEATGVNSTNDAAKPKDTTRRGKQ